VYCNSPCAPTRGHRSDTDKQGLQTWIIVAFTMEIPKGLQSREYIIINDKSKAHSACTRCLLTWGAVGMNVVIGAGPRAI
jgi:hypothetical protein